MFGNQSSKVGQFGKWNPFHWLNIFFKDHNEMSWQFIGGESLLFKFLIEKFKNYCGCFFDLLHFFYNSLTFKFNNFEFYNKIKFWRFHKQTEMLSVNLKRNRNLGDLSTRWVLNFICDTMVSLSFSLARLARSTIWI